MLDLTGHWAGLLSLAIFIIAYVMVILEETTRMRKSKPVLMAAGLIWALIGMAYALAGHSAEVHAEATAVIEEYGELFLFLLVAITYVNTLEERRVFEVLRVKLVALGLGYRQLFWLTGILAFFLSSMLDNLTTALIMGAVVLAVGQHSPRFVALACISLVVAANAGGAFSPFGDITTLMVWQQGKLDFGQFFALFLPALVNWLVPAALMHRALPKTSPAAPDDHGCPAFAALGAHALEFFPAEVGGEGVFAVEDQRAVADEEIVGVFKRRRCAVEHAVGLVDVIPGLEQAVAFLRTGRFRRD